MPQALCALAMTGYKKCGGGGAHGPRPTRAFAILRADSGVCPYGALHAVRRAVGVKKLGGFLVIFNHLKILLLFCNFCVAFLIDLCYTKLR